MALNFSGFSPRAVAGFTLKGATEQLKDRRVRFASLIDTQTTNILNEASQAKKLLDVDIMKNRNALNQGIALGIEDRETLKAWTALPEERRAQFQRSIDVRNSLADEKNASDNIKNLSVYDLLGVSKPDGVLTQDDKIFDISTEWVDATAEQFAGISAAQTNASKDEQASFKENFSNALKTNLGLGSVYDEATEQAINIGGYNNKEALDQLLYKSKRQFPVPPQGIVFKPAPDAAAKLNLAIAQNQLTNLEDAQKQLKDIPIFKGKIYTGDDGKSYVNLLGLGPVPATTKSSELTNYYKTLKLSREALGTENMTDANIRAFRKEFAKDAVIAFSLKYKDSYGGGVIPSAEEDSVKISDSNDARDLGIKLFIEARNKGMSTTDALTLGGKLISEFATNRILKRAFDEAQKDNKDLTFEAFTSQISENTKYAGEPIPVGVKGKIDNFINENKTLQTGDELLKEYLGRVENIGSGIFSNGDTTIEKKDEEKNTRRIISRIQQFRGEEIKKYEANNDGNSPPPEVLQDINTKSIAKVLTEYGLSAELFNTSENGENEVKEQGDPAPPFSNSYLRDNNYDTQFKDAIINLSSSNTDEAQSFQNLYKKIYDKLSDEQKEDLPNPRLVNVKSVNKVIEENSELTILEILKTIRANKQEENENKENAQIDSSEDSSLLTRQFAAATVKKQREERKERENQINELSKGLSEERANVLKQIGNRFINLQPITDEQKEFLIPEAQEVSLTAYDKFITDENFRNNLIDEQIKFNKKQNVQPTKKKEKGGLLSRPEK